MKELPVRVEEFLDYMKDVRNKSIDTVDGYKVDLRMLFKYLRYKKELSKTIDIQDMGNIDINEIDDEFIKSITISELHGFISYVKNVRNNGAAAQARKVACIKSFYNYLVRNDILEKNVGFKLENIEIPKREPVYMTLEQTKKLTETAREEKYTYSKRDYTMIQLFLNSGIRLSELVGLNMDNIDLKEKTIMVIGKGNKQRKISLNSNIINILTDYLEYRETIKSEIVEEDKDAVFISRNHRRINKRTVEKTVKKYMEDSGLDKKKYKTHTCRHTASTLMYKYGKVDIRTLQKILGHSSPSVTQIYTSVDDEQMQEAVNSMPEF